MREPGCELGPEPGVPGRVPVGRPEEVAVTPSLDAGPPPVLPVVEGVHGRHVAAPVDPPVLVGLGPSSGADARGPAAVSDAREVREAVDVIRRRRRVDPVGPAGPVERRRPVGGSPVWGRPPVKVVGPLRTDGT